MILYSISSVTNKEDVGYYFSRMVEPWCNVNVKKKNVLGYSFRGQRNVRAEDYLGYTEKVLIYRNPREREVTGWVLLFLTIVSLSSLRSHTCTPSVPFRVYT